MNEILFSIQIKNPLYDWWLRRRLSKAVDKWNRDLHIITKNIHSPEDLFKWDQLVWQEIDMYIRLNKVEDFSYICDRRGFNNEQRAYLKEMLEYMGFEVKDEKTE